MSTLPPIFRHLILVVLAAVLSWAGTDLVPALNGQTGYGAILGALVTALLAYFTPLVQAYGVGAKAPFTTAARLTPLKRDRPLSREDAADVDAIQRLNEGGYYKPILIVVILVIVVLILFGVHIHN